MTNLYAGTYQRIGGELALVTDDKSGKILVSSDRGKMRAYVTSQFAYFGDQNQLDITSLLEKKLILPEALLDLDQREHETK